MSHLETERPPGEPSSNALAQAGLITNEAGRVFQASCGRLELPWLLVVSRESRRLARERFEKSKSVSDEERYGWFIASTEAEFKGLKALQKEDWRRALQAWKGGSLYNVHNCATLHRALYLSGRSVRPDAHLRESLRLYHHLSEKAPEQRLYRIYQEELVEHLKDLIKETYRRGDDKSTAKSLRLLARTMGLAAVERLQAEFFQPDLENLRIHCARLQKELLNYQGLAHPPPLAVLEQCDEDLTNVVVPLAARFSHKLIEGSRERNEVELLVAQVCGVLSQSYAKAGDTRGAKKWMGEALRWEPTAVKDWRNLPAEDFGDEESAVVVFSEKPEEVDESPSSHGTRLFGVQAVPVKTEAGETREEHLESVFVGFLPLFPLRRFAAYRNLDTGEIGYYLRIPMTSWDHLRQGVVILLLSFFLTLATLAVVDRVTERPTTESSLTLEEKKEQIEATVEQLKGLAQTEARLNGLATRTPEQEKKLKAIQTERMELIRKLEELEKRPAR